MTSSNAAYRIQLMPLLTDDFTSDVTLHNNEILTFLRNGVTGARHRLENPAVAAEFSMALWEGVHEWVENGSIAPHDVVFVLANVAHALQDELMRKENPKCPRMDSRNLLLPTSAS